MLEAMIFSYFFKRIDRTDAGLVALFGSVRTLAFIFVPLIGSLVFIFIDGIQTIFIIGGIAIMFALIPVLKIHDTR
jgi:hypothetical protein